MKKAIRFSIIVCLFSWAMFAVVHWGFGMGADTPMGLMVFSSIYMFFPMITALVLQAIDKENSTIRVWSTSRLEVLGW